MAVVAVTKERAPGESRVAATPESVKKLAALGLSVTVETGAGLGASIPDSDYEAAGATWWLENLHDRRAGADELRALVASGPPA